MHLILPHAASQQWPASALSGLHLPHLQRLLAQLGGEGLQQGAAALARRVRSDHAHVPVDGGVRGHRAGRGRGDVRADGTVYLVFLGA